MKHVILTGGSRGIGAELVLALLSAGYRVSTCSRNRSPFIEELSKGSFSGNFYYSQLDMEDVAAYETFLDGCITWGGPLHGLINNAGIAMAGILATFPNV